MLSVRPSIHNSTQLRWCQVTAFCKLPSLLALAIRKLICSVHFRVKSEHGRSKWDTLSVHCSSVGIAQAFGMWQSVAILSSPYSSIYLERGRQGCPSLLRSSEGSWPGYAYQGLRKPGSLFPPVAPGWPVQEDGPLDGPGKEFRFLWNYPVQWNGC